MPLEAYNFFINKFVDAIRHEIARSAEKAYESLRFSDMQKILMIECPEEMKRFISANTGVEGINWNISGDRIFFSKLRQEIEEIPSFKMINLSLGYATELNRIV